MGVEKLCGANAIWSDTTHVDDVGHVLAMRMLAKVRGCTNDDIKAIDTSFHSQTSIVHVAADVGEDLGLETELADGLAVLSRCFRGSRRSKFNIVDSELVESLGNLDLGLDVEEGVRELLALTEGRLD